MAKYVTRTITFYDHVFGDLKPDGNGGYNVEVIAHAEDLKKHGSRSVRKFKAAHGIPENAQLVSVVERQELRGMTTEDFVRLSTVISDEEAEENDTEE